MPRRPMQSRLVSALRPQLEHFNKEVYCKLWTPLAIAIGVIKAFKKHLTADFKARPIPEFAKHLRGQALVDYVNKAQPFFKAKLPSMSYEQLKYRIMDWKYIETSDPMIRGKAPEIETEIPER
ncbi:unnamed protein product [Strongylus vulgaris]|uniref:Uncharacterized protein n=1 Tax=Strongylus vulgaris TaxID=40348 RepID=A0A3P7LXB5_STRVU|nr:unnamed protein product [Strongylus vulgaris]